MPNGKYILSDGGLNDSNTEIQIGITVSGAYREVALTRNGEVEFTANGDDFSADSINPVIQCLVRKDQTNVNVTFKPMIRLATDTDSTYQPYAQTNKELTDKKVDWKTNGIIGAKNLIFYPYATPSGSQPGNRGITFTYSEEGYVSLDGTASTTSQPFMMLVSGDASSSRKLKIKSGEKYTLSMERTDNRLWAIVYFKNLSSQSTSVETNAIYEDGTVRHITSSDYVSLSYSNVNHTSVTFEVITSGEYYIQIDIRVATSTGSYNPTNAKARVMLRLGEDTDDTWRPFAMTNKELTDVVNNVPTTAGTYTLQAVRNSDNTISYSWV